MKIERYRRPFFATGRTLIDVQEGKLILRVQNEQVTFNVFKAMKYPSEIDMCLQIDTIDKEIIDSFHDTMPNDTLEECIVHSGTTQSTNTSIQEYARYWEASPFYLLSKKPELEELCRSPSRPKPSIEEPPKHKLKPLPSHLRYAYLDDNSKLPVIISSALTDLEKEKVLRVLRDHKAALGWTIADIKRISP